MASLNSNSQSHSSSLSSKDRSPILNNPFDELSSQSSSPTSLSPYSSDSSISPNRYEVAIQHGRELQARPTESVSKIAIRRQHQKGRMTIWERIKVLADGEPMILFQNWGPNLDGG